MFLFQLQFLLFTRMFSREFIIDSFLVKTVQTLKISCFSVHRRGYILSLNIPLYISPVNTVHLLILSHSRTRVDLDFSCQTVDSLAKVRRYFGSVGSTNTHTRRADVEDLKHSCLVFFSVTVYICNYFCRQTRFA